MLTVFCFADCLTNMYFFASDQLQTIRTNGRDGMNHLTGCLELARFVIHLHQRSAVASPDHIPCSLCQVRIGLPTMQIGKP